MFKGLSSFRGSGLVCICFLTTLFTPASNALQQTLFERHDSHPLISLNYQWREAAGQNRNLSVELDKDSFLSSLKRFRNYDPKRANRELFKRLHRYIRQQNYRGVEVDLGPREQHINVSVRNGFNRQQQAEYQQQAQRVRDYYKQQWTDYLSANFYQQLTLPLGEHGIIPDAVAIAKSQRPLFKPVIDQIGQTLRDNSRRSYANFIAQFIQAIPYTTLEDGINSRGDGFIPPNQVLFYNQGDCDSKASLMAALLHPIIPQAKMAIIYLPGHALFAVNMASEKGDSMIRHDGSEMVLVEVAGPAMMSAGTISQQSQFYIDSGQYSVISLN